MIRVVSEQSGGLGAVHSGMWVNPSKPAVHTQFTHQPFINADYRGELGIILINHGDSAFTISRSMRIAQLVVAPVAPVAQAVLAEVAELPATARGAGGFGSTGTGK